MHCLQTSCCLVVLLCVACQPSGGHGPDSSEDTGDSGSLFETETTWDSGAGEDGTSSGSGEDSGTVTGDIDTVSEDTGHRPDSDSENGTDTPGDTGIVDDTETLSDADTTTAVDTGADSETRQETEVVASDSDIDGSTESDTDTMNDTGTDTDTSDNPWLSWVLNVWFKSPSGDQYQGLYWEVNGTVSFYGETEFAPVENIETDYATYYLEITDENDESWQLGYFIRNAGGDDISPRLPLTAGDAVTVVVVQGRSFSTDYGFSVSDSVGLVGAFEEGMELKDVSPEAMDGLEVTRGDLYDAIIEDECGIIHGQTMDFSRDTTVNLKNGERGAVDMGAYSVTALNVRSFLWDECVCYDVPTYHSFAAWRE